MFSPLVLERGVEEITSPLSRWSLVQFQPPSPKMNRIRHYIWWKLADCFHVYKTSDSGIEYVIAYGKSKIVQFFHIISPWRFAWMYLTLPAYIRSALFNAGWISDEVFDRMAPSFGMKKKRWRIEKKY